MSYEAYQALVKQIEENLKHIQRTLNGDDVYYNVNKDTAHHLNVAAYALKSAEESVCWGADA